MPTSSILENMVGYRERMRLLLQKHGQNILENGPFRYEELDTFPPGRLEAYLEVMALRLEREPMPTDPEVLDAWRRTLWMTVIHDPPGT